jgi:cyclopropane-fatty-acyl-phospholipid synthase
MAVPLAVPSDRFARTTLRLLPILLGSYRPLDFAVRLWDGTIWGPGEGQPARFTLVLRRPGALRRMFLSPTEVSLGDAYAHGDFDVEGDFESAFSLGDHIVRMRMGSTDWVRCAPKLIGLPSDDRPPSREHAVRLRGTRHSLARDREAVRSHYELSNDFFSLWLDHRMVYSTAYFSAPEEDLDAAQERKLEYICRKLRLLPGERLLDIGCGWGGLVLHAAKTRDVKAVGITLSRPQAELAGQRIREERLTDRCRVEVLDYREIEDPSGYDKIASIGMFEHVGESRMEEYFGRAWRLLRPGGVFLNHGIASGAGEATYRGPSFIDRYIFPDGDLIPIGTTLRVAERCGFEVRDVESLREHYVLTLRHWVRRLEAHSGRARQIVDEVTFRKWRLYLWGSAYWFRVGRNNVYQALLVKPDGGRSGMPLTRTDWYS